MQQIVKIVESEFKTYYQAKANDSFKTKLELYFFDKVIYNKQGHLNLEEFTAFQISNELVNYYSTVYWQMEKDFILEPCGLTCQNVYENIAQLHRINYKNITEFRKDYVFNQFPKIFKQSDFDELVKEKHCKYCNITMDEINDLADKRQIRKKNLRGWKLEIDRLNSNLEYKPDNCVMACYWCNNAKTDEFTAEEFMEVGNAIRKIWDKRKNCAETVS